MNAQHTTVFRVHGGFPQLFRVHLAQTSQRWMERPRRDSFTSQSSARAEAGYRLTTLATLINATSSSKPRSFSPSVQIRRYSPPVIKLGDPADSQIHTWGTHARIGSNRFCSALVRTSALPLAAVLFFVVQFATSAFTQRVTVCSSERSASVMSAKQELFSIAFG